MSVEELADDLRESWSVIKDQLLTGTYQPSAVKRQEIPKNGGGTRMLGIPTVRDRFIQQAILQVLQPMYDPTFSEHSHGFRPGRGAHGAVRKAQRYIQEGRHWVVDVDLEKFFDRVHHDVLMGKLAQRLKDKRMLGIIHRFLKAGIMADGVVMERFEATPQGGPLSPLLANVLLDEVDKRVMQALARLYDQLRLRINQEQSAVARVWDRKFLGYSFWVAKGRVVECRVAAKALEEMKARVREITSRSGGRSMAQVVERLGTYLRGWKNYFQFARTPGVFDDLDKWIVRRLRALQLKHWKRPYTVVRKLRVRGVSEFRAWGAGRYARGWWHIAAHPAVHLALPRQTFAALGLPRLAAS